MYICIYAYMYACMYAKQTNFISHIVCVFTSNIFNVFKKSYFIFNVACK